MYRRPVSDTNLFVGKPHKGQSNPAIPEVEDKEIAVSEKLTQIDVLPTPEEIERVAREHWKTVDKRLLESKPYHPIMVPKLNELYSTLRTGGDWRYCIDNYAIGQFTPVAGATIQVPVTMAIALDNKRLSQWPGSTQLYLCMRAYAHTPVVQTLATVVGMTVIFQDNSGMGVPVGANLSNVPQNTQNLILFPSPIVDAGMLTVGNLLVKLEATGTVTTYDYMLAFSYAYLMASDTPYERPIDTKGGPLYVSGSKSDTRNPLT
jgi:hypothetical protein